MVGGHSRERAHRAVTTAGHDTPTTVERVAGSCHQVACVGRQVDLDVEIDTGERVEHVGEPGLGATPTGRGVDDRGPGVGYRSH